MTSVWMNTIAAGSLGSRDMEAVAAFLAIDLGASGGRVLTGRYSGAQMEVDELHRFENAPVNVLGHLHWDPLYLWTEIKKGLRKYTSQYGEDLEGIGVNTWGVDFALLDQTDRLLGNPYHYRDARTDGVPDMVISKVAAEQLYQRTGIQVMQINTLYQLYSMMENQSPQLKNAATLLMMPDLFRYWLSGEKTSEYTIASTSQMLECHSRRWDIDLLTNLGLPTQMLLPLIEPGTTVGTLHSSVASDIGIAYGTPVIATCGHDTANAVAAIPDLDEASIYISSGTWSLIGVEVREPVVNEQAKALNFTNEGGVEGTIRLLKNLTGLWLLQESRRQWQREGRELDWPEILEQAAQVKAFRSLVDPDASEFLSPGNMPAALRLFCRRTEQSEPRSVGEVARCCLESLALKYRWCVGALEELLQRRLERIHVVGGGSQISLLNQFTADACNRPVIAGPVEATALGNLMMQAIARGHISDVARGRRIIGASVDQRHFEPKHVEAWQEAFARFSGLLEELNQDRH